MIYAVYRCLYGEDFIQQSIKSIENYVDKIFIFWDDTPWADATQCTYKGNVVKFPKKFDNILDKIKELNNPKIELIYDHQYDNVNQFTRFINGIILPNYDIPDMIMCIEVDHVWRKDQLENCLLEYKNHAVSSSSQIFLWRSFDYKLDYNRRRPSVVFWNMKKVNILPRTGRQAECKEMEYLNGYVHNLGYCISEKVMYWKHMTALGFSQKIRDSAPDEMWYENKWLNWDYETNNQNLEPSKGYEHFIPRAEKYNLDELPEILK